MYTDPSQLREHVVKLRFNDNEDALLDAWARYTGQQKAVLLREMLLEQARLDMEAHLGLAVAANEGPQLGLFRASSGPLQGPAK